MNIFFSFLQVISIYMSAFRIIITISTNPAMMINEYINSQLKKMNVKTKKRISSHKFREKGKSEDQIHRFFDNPSVKSDLVRYPHQGRYRSKTAILSGFKELQIDQKRQIMEKQYPTDFDFVFQKLKNEHEKKRPEKVKEEFENRLYKPSDFYDPQVQLRYLIFNMKVLYQYMKKDYKKSQRKEEERLKRQERQQREEIQKLEGSYEENEEEYHLRLQENSLPIARCFQNKIQDFQFSDENLFEQVKEEAVQEEVPNQTQTLEFVFDLFSTHEKLLTEDVLDFSTVGRKTEEGISVPAGLQFG